MPPTRTALTPIPPFVLLGFFAYYTESPTILLGGNGISGFAERLTFVLYSLGGVDDPPVPFSLSLFCPSLTPYLCATRNVYEVSVGL